MTTVVETPVVSTTVSQSPNAINISSQAIVLLVPTVQTNTPSPKKVYTRKRKFQVYYDDIPAPDPISSAPYNITKPQPFIPPKLFNPIKDPIELKGYVPADFVPVVASYPLELHAVKNEMRQFYTVDDPSKRKFPSLIGYRDPANMDEYLKLKVRQADLRAKLEYKGKSDNETSSYMQFLLTKVKKLEDYARDLSKEMSTLPPEAGL
ncbi:hypothetical protein Hanom_Chr03g00219561 [Helianthus anomalus]